MKIVVVGGGGHARSVIDALRTSAAGFDPIACTDPDPARAGERVDGVPIVGGDERLEDLLRDGVHAACVGLGGVGDNRPRAELFGRLQAIGFQLPPIVHGRAYVAESAQVGPGSVILLGALVAAGATLGVNVIVNSGAIVEHDCVIEDHVHVATGCHLGGGAVVEALAHIGLGASVLQERRVGNRAIVGAGATVVDDVGPEQVTVGTPAVPRPRTRMPHPGG